MRKAVLGLLLLGACGDGEQPLPPERPNAQVAEPGPVKLPNMLNIAGRWAASERLCADGWWDFTDYDVRTAGEMVCSIVTDDRTETTATLQITCVGEGVPTTETWRLRDVGGRLSVTRGAAPPVTLARCTKDPLLSR